MMIYSLTTFLSCMGTGKFSAQYGRNIPFLFALVLDVANYTFCLSWNINSGNAWLTYLVFACFGLSLGIWNTLIVGECFLDSNRQPRPIYQRVGTLNGRNPLFIFVNIPTLILSNKREAYVTKIQHIYVDFITQQALLRNVKITLSTFNHSQLVSSI